MRTSEEARGFGGGFIDRYSDAHHLGGRAMGLPADVHFGRVEQRVAERQAPRNVAFAAHPERFPHGRSIAPRPDCEVRINTPRPAAIIPPHRRPSVLPSGLDTPFAPQTP